MSVQPTGLYWHGYTYTSPGGYCPDHSRPLA